MGIAKELMRRTVARVRAGRERRSSARRGLVVVHHSVAERSGDPRRELAPAIGANLLRDQIRLLRRRYEVVPLLELPERIHHRQGAERLPVSLTFDDDLSSHLSIAAPILSELRVPATFFLTGSSMDGPSPYWWQDLQALDDDPATRAALRDRLGERWAWARRDAELHSLAATIEALPPGERDDVARLLRDLNESEPEPGLPARAVGELASAGFEIGFHTRRHYNLQTLAENELDEAMREGRDDLEAAAATRIRTVAYPHGRADLRVAEAAAGAGFDLGVTCANRAVTAAQLPHLVDRMIGWSPSAGDFALKLVRLTQA